MAKLTKSQKGTGKKKSSASAKARKPSVEKARSSFAAGDDTIDSDDLPPDEAAIEAEVASLDAEKLAAEVEQQEGKGQDDEGESVLDDPPLPAFAATDEATDDVDAVLPSMEGMSILRETELNDVINDVKRRSEVNGGYVTYEELNQILPQNIVDAIQSDRYLKILEALGVHVIREEDVKKYIEAKNAKSSDPKSRAAEMIEDPIRMYLHQMGQVQLLSRDEEVDICQTIEDAEVKIRDMFNRFLFAPPMYASMLDKLEGQSERFDRIVTDKFEDNRDSYMALIPGFRKDLKERNVQIIEAHTPIVPIYTYEPENTLIKQKGMYDQGVYVNSVLPPACAPGECLLRTTLMASHTDALIDEAADIIARVMKMDNAEIMAQ